MSDTESEIESGSSGSSNNFDSSDNEDYRSIPSVLTCLYISLNRLRNLIERSKHQAAKWTRMVFHKLGLMHDMREKKL